MYVCVYVDDDPNWTVVVCDYYYEKDKDKANG